MANVLKSDISAREKLTAEQHTLALAQAEYRVSLARFKVFLPLLLFIVLSTALLYQLTKPTLWVVEGALIAALVFWASLVAPQVVKLRRVQSQLRAIEHGLKGEEDVAKTLAQGLSDEYFVINDITLALDKQETQIDHVVITPREVLCIETKNWRGIYRPGRTGWLWQPLHSRGKSRWHKDPQTQSLMHSSALGQYLVARGITAEIQALVVLADPESQWKGEGVHEECPVIYVSELIKFINHRASKTKCRLSSPKEVAHAVLSAHIRRGDSQ